ncbi:MAG: YbjQ family protein [Elusimicrobiota bacterium]|jgi:uncharacterized protein YbjQ (UPF0145 family)|nr:YbjQ family protein [Elusimicrobiota bacterium]
MELLIILALLSIAYTTGTLIEELHYRHLMRREKAALTFPIVTFEREDVLSKDRPIKEIRLVSASAVVGVDYFKMFAGAVKSFFGGRLSVLESVMDRARREAVIRLKEQALGCDIVLNLRLETISLNAEAYKTWPKAAVVAYGTAITYQ